MIHPDDVTAVVLTGGKSTRMGRDKAFVPIAGKPLIGHVLDGLSGVFTRILLSANDPGPYAEFGLPVVADIEAEWGALAGIHAALLAAPTDWIFALAVDMPLVDPALIRAVLERAEPTPSTADTAPSPPAHSIAAVIPHGLGFHQPFHAAYGPRALHILKPFEGQPCHIHQLVSHPDVLHIPEEEMCRVSPDLHAFLNANTPRELEDIRTLLTQRAAGNG